MNYIVAVSGGVDSVVLLDMLTKTDHRLIVAHVDHGIRGDDSQADARFVRALAGLYGLPFISTSLYLGCRASEESARKARYDFLFEQAKKYNAKVVTAHHRDDLVETIALNLCRGTGWRGLAVLGRSDVVRPLISLSKDQIYDYAIRNKLEWVEDSTNSSEVYLRNRLRRRIGRLLSATDSIKLAKLRARQLQLRHDIDREVGRLGIYARGSRYFIGQIDETCAIELIGAEIELLRGNRLLRQQLIRVLYAIKVGRPGTNYDVGDSVRLHLTSRKYEVTVI